MSEWVAGIKLVAEGVGKLLGHQRARRDPIRATAQRVLDVFAAHRVAPPQISRLLPAAFAIPMQDFASAGTLKAHLTPALLDWVADFFALNRAWLDGVAEQAHQTLCCYKQPLDFARWLAERRSGEPFQFRLFVLKPSRRPISPDSDEDVMIVVEEHLAWLDEQAICRYYRCDGDGPLDRYPVIQSLLGMCAVADRGRCLVRGRVVAQKHMDAVAAGRLLLPQVLGKCRASWTPDALLSAAPAADQTWQQQLRNDVARDLEALPVIKADHS